MNYNNMIIEADFIDDGRDTLPRHKSKKWPSRDVTKLLGVVLHQSLDNYGTAYGNAKYHVGPNHISKDGLPGLAYTLFVDRHKNIVILANDVEDATYSQGNRDIPGDENALYLSVCVGCNASAPGYIGAVEPTIKQLDLVTKLWEHLKKIFYFSDNQLFGHYDFGKATCPGYAITDIIEGYNKTDIIKYPSYLFKQRMLYALGYYSGDIDGEWGPMSRHALTCFQTDYDLIPDGVWGKKTNIIVQEVYHQHILNTVY